MTDILTKEGHEKLTRELERLKQEERPRVARDLKEAILQGDISENAAYTEAKERQLDIDMRIKEIGGKLSSARVASPSRSKDVIDIGATFKVIEEGTRQERTFSIVGPQEASPQEGKISFDSPLGGAFLGKRQGETVEVVAPGGKREYRVIEIK